MTMLVQRQLVLAKVETVYGTDSSPTGSSNAIQVTNLSFTKNTKMNSRNVIKPTFAPLQQLPGQNSVEFSFDVEMKGSGTAGTSPTFDALLQGCAHNPTIVASTSVTYAPISTGYKSVTIYLYGDGDLWKATGCFGSVSYDIKTGGIPMAKFKFNGHLESHTDAAEPSATFSSVVPPVAMNATVTIGSYTPIMSSFTLDVGNKVEMPESIGSVDGYAPFIISSRDVKGTFSIEATTIAVNDVYGQLSGGTNLAFSLAIGSTAGNIITFTNSNLYITDVKRGNSNGIITYDVSYSAVESGSDTDDEFKIAFT